MLITPGQAQPTVGAAATSAAPAAFTDLPLGASIVRIYAVDMQMLTQAEFSLGGQAPEGTVISVNDDFTVVGADQKFAILLQLEEGPNLVEIEASNAQGQDATLGLVLTYDPSP